MHSVAVLYEKMNVLSISERQEKFGCQLMDALLHENILIRTVQKGDDNKIDIYLQRDHMWFHLDEDQLELEIWPDRNRGVTWSYYFDREQITSMMLITKQHYHRGAKLFTIESL
jgi:hypothetical protein